MSNPLRGELRGPDDSPTRAADISLFARIESLIGEEDALLRIPVHARTQHQHDRLRAIGEELDQIWERLRERGRRLAKGQRDVPEGGGSTSP